MRFTAFILSILILVLSCLPCDDAAGMPTMKNNVNNEQSSHEDHNEPGDIDTCSPFCHCACCASFSVLHAAVTIPDRTDATNSTPYTGYLSTDLVEISLPIWQPPQLV